MKDASRSSDLSVSTEQRRPNIDPRSRDRPRQRRSGRGPNEGKQRGTGTRRLRKVSLKHLYMPMCGIGRQAVVSIAQHTRHLESSQKGGERMWVNRGACDNAGTAVGCAQAALMASIWPGGGRGRARAGPRAARAAQAASPNTMARTEGPGRERRRATRHPASPGAPAAAI